MKLYCYHIAPIDFWCGALTRDELEASIEDSYESGSRDHVKKSVGLLIAKSEQAFRKIGWEGDVRDGPYFFAVPSDTQMDLGYVLKQDNNGNCFVASPVELSERMVSIFDQITIE